MVKDFIQRFSGGADGVNITGTNSASGTSGDAFNSIILNSGTDITSAGNACFTYNSAAALEGTTGARMNTSGITGNTYGLWNVPSGNGKRGIYRVPLNFPTAPSATHIVGRFSTASSFFQLLLQTNRTLQVVNGSGGGIVASNSAVLATNTQYWVEFAITIGTTTSNGVAEYQVFTNSNTDGTGTDTLVTSWTSGATLNTGTDSDFSSVRFHIPLATSGWSGLNTDLWRARFTSVTTSWIGPYVSSLPPLGTPTLNSPCAVLGYVGSGGTSPYSYGISQLSGPAGTATLIPGTNNQWRIPVPDGTDSVWRVIVSDDNGQTAQDDVTIPKAVGGTPAVQVKKWSGSAWV